MIRRRTFVVAGGAFAATLAFRAIGQTGKLPRVSFLSSTSQKAYGHLVEEFRAGLRSVGYVEGSNLILDLWWADDRLERLPALIAEVMASKPAVIVTHGSTNVAALQKATTSVPIVFASVGDPVGQGFIASYRRPGGNITGTVFNDGTNEKVYELVKIVMPQVSRVASLVNPDNPAAKQHLDIIPSTTRALGLQYLVVNATGAQELEPAFAQAAAAKAQALVVSAHAPFIGLHSPLVELQFKHRLPTFYGMREGAAAGGLASYGSLLEENYRRTAALVHEILKGGNPAQIPVAMPSNYEIAINLKTAAALGIKVPQNALLRAHTVIRS